MGAEFKKVIPRNGVVVRFPRNYAILSKDGANVPWIGADGRYWRRRVADGDVEIVSETFIGIDPGKEKDVSSVSRKYKEEK